VSESHAAQAMEYAWAYCERRLLQASELHVATGTSSQFLSGLLMAAAVFDGEGSVTVKSASDSVVSEP
jgi:hypothetical protein